jgi:regulatory protein
VIITKIQRLRGRKSHYRVSLEGSHSLELSDWTIGKFGLRKGDDIDDAAIAKIKEAEAETQAKNIAVNYLSYRRRSSKEIRDHLVRKGFDRESSEKVVRDLQSAGMLDDREFARSFVKDRLLRKPVGLALLRRQLLAKGIPSGTAEEVLEELVSARDQQNAAVELLKQRMRLAHRSLSGLDEVKRKKRLVDFLLRRGFSYDVTMKTIRTALGN